MSRLPDWSLESLPIKVLPAVENQKIDSITVADKAYTADGQCWRASAIAASIAQKQTEECFGFKWQQEYSFISDASLARNKAWSQERYGDIHFLFADKQPKLLLDAGCGAAMSTIGLFGDFFKQIQYVGVEISEAIHIAQRRLLEHGVEGLFLKDSLMELPFVERTFDIIYSNGVLHHTDSTKSALLELARLLRPGGFFLFYVYRKKGPIREFSDDYIREALQCVDPATAWEKLKPLTQLGIELGNANATISIPERIDFLDMQPGAMTIQRFVYWHIFKAFYHPEASFDEMHHINFDWYYPKNAHRQTIEEVRAWCDEAGLSIHGEYVAEPGIAVVAQKNV